MLRVIVDFSVCVTVPLPFLLTLYLFVCSPIRHHCFSLALGYALHISSLILHHFVCNFMCQRNRDIRILSYADSKKSKNIEISGMRKQKFMLCSNTRATYLIRNITFTLESTVKSLIRLQGGKPNDILPGTDRWRLRRRREIRDRIGLTYSN